MEWKKLLLDSSFAKEEGELGLPLKSDYDRIICSTLFRRLQDKAQVFPLDEDDYVRTRLTHSLEVSAIGKKLGEHVYRKLKKAKVDDWFEEDFEKDFSDVLLCAGLVHDIGNPPFGHFGEYAIREWFQAHLKELELGGKKVTDLLSTWQIQDLYAFEGNAQSLRLLSKTPYLGSMNGFLLSHRVLGAIMKYPISSEALGKQNPRRYKKMGYYYSEKQIFEEVSQTTGMQGCRHPLSFLLEAADDIAYRTSDLEDAMVKKVVNYSDIRQAFTAYVEHLSKEDGCREAVLACIEHLQELYREEVSKKGRKPELTAVQRWNQYLQARMIEDAADAFLKYYAEIMQGSFHGDLFGNTLSGHMIEAIAGLSEELIYTSSIKTKAELFGRRVIDSLLTEFMPAAVKYDTEEPQTFIERRIMDTVSGFYKSMYHAEAKDKTEGEKLYLRLLMITDYISGMTDNYAKRLYQELFASRID